MRALATTAGALTLLVATVAPASGATARSASRAEPHVALHPLRRPTRPRGTPSARAAIVGGTPAQPDTYPWLAFVIDDVSGSGFTCTGTVVAPNVVLTAAHCVENPKTGELNETSGYTVVTGNVEWSGSPRHVSGISRLVVDPDFNRSTLTNDAGLLVLSTPTSAPAITLASYPLDSHLLEAGTAGAIAGWGLTGPSQGEPTEALQVAGTVVQRPGYCAENASPFYREDELCTLDAPALASGVCYGDSGGPLIAPDPAGPGVVELGLASHVYDECSTLRPSVFTRADLIASWVHAWTEALEPASASQAADLATPELRQPAHTVDPTTGPHPPNPPGYYSTRRSRVRRIVVHVASDGEHIVGLSIRMPVPCRHRPRLPLELSLPSSVAAVPIRNHAARETLDVATSGEHARGQVFFSGQFDASGVLKGQVSVDIPSRSADGGYCAGTLRFTATTAGPPRL